MLPVRLVTTPSQAIGESWSESKRNKALMLGLPALIIALLAVSAIGGVQFLSKKSLEDTYVSRFEQASSDLAEMRKKLIRKQKVQAIDQDDRNSITDEDREGLRKLHEAQKIYLDKLISIAPDNDNYRFDLAKLVATQPDGRAHAFSILNELAPEDTPGFPDAHFVLAQNYFEKPARTAMTLSGNLAKALKHVDHVITRDEENLRAKLLKARILARTQRYDGAYDLFEELFDENPNYYTEMTKLNEVLGRSDRDRQLHEKALTKFQQLSGDEEIQTDDRRWIVVETGIAKTLHKLERFEEAEQRLDGLIRRYAADPKGGPRRVFLQRLIADTYIVWAGSIADPGADYNSLPPNELAELLDKYTLAYQNYPGNVIVLQSLSRLSLSAIPGISEKAREVYDPRTDLDAPSSVLNQLGNDALLNKRFAEAIRFYERARGKSPKSSAILNNLAYSYLVADENDRNAERAEQLINESLRNLPKGLDEVEVSKFLHTKGTALKQQDRLQEALAVFERALRARPNHADTLRSLIECYRGLNKLPPELYVERLAAISEPDQDTPSP